jgi:uncharacterized membrane protein
MTTAEVRDSQRFTRSKYRIMLLVLFGCATILSLTILQIRVTLTGSYDFTFLIWNLFLAWIPFIISLLTYTLTINRTWLYLILACAAFTWLIFFPNAPYILTDFQHLARDRGSVPAWFDVMLLIWFSFTGLLLGIVSLFMMQELVRREFGHWLSWGFVIVVSCLSSIGIYMGRFLRWNSWDILQNPKGIALFTLQRAQTPSLQSVTFTILFTAFFLFLYATIYTLGHLLLERKEKEQKQSRQ